MNASIEANVKCTFEKNCVDGKAATLLTKKKKPLSFRGGQARKTCEFCMCLLLEKK